MAETTCRLCWILCGLFLSTGFTSFLQLSLRVIDEGEVGRWMALLGGGEGVLVTLWSASMEGWFVLLTWDLGDDFLSKELSYTLMYLSLLFLRTIGSLTVQLPFLMKSAGTGAPRLWLSDLSLTTILPLLPWRECPRFIRSALFVLIWPRMSCCSRRMLPDRSPPLPWEVYDRSIEPFPLSSCPIRSDWTNL